MVVLLKVPDIKAVLVALMPPVTPPVTVGTAQLNSVPAGILPLMISVGVKEKAVPLHLTEDIALMVAKGLTVTVTVKADPLQVPDCGVMR